MAVGVSTAPAVLSCPEEKEESNPDQIDGCFLAVCFALTGGIDYLEDRDGGRVDSGRRRVLLCVSRELLSQAKVELAQLVVPKFDGPHGYEYIPDGTKVLFHGYLLDRNPSGFQKSVVHALRKEMEESYGIPNTLEVVWYSQPFVEISLLVPGSGVFLEDGG